MYISLNPSFSNSYYKAFGCGPDLALFLQEGSQIQPMQDDSFVWQDIISLLDSPANFDIRLLRIFNTQKLESNHLTTIEGVSASRHKHVTKKASPSDLPFQFNLCFQRPQIPTELRLRDGVLEYETDLSSALGSNGDDGDPPIRLF